MTETAKIKKKQTVAKEIKEKVQIDMGNRLSEIRKKKATQKEFVKKLKYNRTTLSRWEYGTSSIPPRRLYQLALIFETDINYFYGSDTPTQIIRAEGEKSKEEIQELMGKRLRMAREGTLRKTQDGKIIEHPETLEYLASKFGWEYSIETMHRWEKGIVAIPHYVIVDLIKHYNKSGNYFYGFDSQDK